MTSEYITTKAQSTPKKSLVDVCFMSCDRTYTYWNDQFDLHIGDTVFVEGKLEGQRGRVVGVHYSFKIKPADYKRVLSVADTEVHGELFLAGAYLVAFDRQVLPMDKVRTWYFPPVKEEEEYVYGEDAKGIVLQDFTGLCASEKIFDKGITYYKENHVRYLSLQEGHGYAIVAGSEEYEVEFTYQDGKVYNLTCSCYCSGTCKHEVAVLLQLRELIKYIEAHYAQEYAQSGGFAAVAKSAFFSMVVNTREKGSIRI